MCNALECSNSRFLEIFLCRNLIRAMFPFPSKGISFPLSPVSMYLSKKGPFQQQIKFSTKVHANEHHPLTLPRSPNWLSQLRFICSRLNRFPHHLSNFALQSLSLWTSYCCSYCCDRCCNLCLLI